MHRFWIAAAAVTLASPAWAQERMVGDFRVSEQPNAATKTTDYVASSEQRDIAFALRCKAGRQDMVLQFPGAQARIGSAKAGDPVVVQLRIDEGDILDLKATITAVLPDRVEVSGGSAEDMAKLLGAGRVGVRYTLGPGGYATSILVFNDLETVVKAVQRACRPKS